MKFRQVLNVKNLIVISVFSTFLFSCNTERKVGHAKQNDKIAVIKQEINNNVKSGETLRVNNNCENKYFLFFLNKLSSNKSTPSWNLNAGEVNRIFSKSEVANFKDQLENGDCYIASSLIKENALNKNVKFYDNNQKNNKTKNAYFEDFTPEKIILSQPVLSLDKKYCLIWFSKGTRLTMYTGVNIYIKNKKKWEFYRTVYSEME